MNIYWLLSNLQKFNQLYTPDSPVDQIGNGTLLLSPLFDLPLSSCELDKAWIGTEKDRLFKSEQGDQKINTYFTYISSHSTKQDPLNVILAILGHSGQLIDH